MSESDLKTLASALRALISPPGTITRSAFDALSNAEKSAHCRAGGKITDDPKVAKVINRPALPAKTAYRDSFDALTPESKAALCREGYKIIDR